MENDLAYLAALMHAAGHVTRLQVLSVMALDGRDWSPKQLADEIGVKLANVSYHMRFLREGSLIESTGQKQRRGAVEHFYRLTSDGHRLMELLGLDGEAEGDK